ncbi:MAG: hypothetical protein GY757_40645 [bacterium]|nr:hypothetical protein [bacterium]
MEDNKPATTQDVEKIIGEAMTTLRDSLMDSIKAVANSQDELARIINNSFNTQTEHFDTQLVEIKNELDSIKYNMSPSENDTNKIKLLENDIVIIKKHLGIKTKNTQAIRQ